MESNHQVLDAFKQLKETLEHVKPLPYQPYEGCAREIIFQERTVTLYHYQPLTKTQLNTPLLLVFALVNRPTILDLQSDLSFIKQVLNAGIPVYLIDWGYPSSQDNELSLSVYVTQFLKLAVQALKKRHKVAAINLLGVCQGGVMCLSYAALYPKQVKNLITMMTPVDFHTADNKISQLVRHVDIDMLLQRFGNFPGHLLGLFFISLKPYELTLGKAALLQQIKNNPVKLRRFLEVERWLGDTPDQAASAFRQFAIEFFQHNGLIKNKIKLGKRVVRLEKITMPMLNIIANDDHIVPPSASIKLGELIASEDYELYEYNAGHIGIYLSQQALHTVPKMIYAWLAKRDN